jgi:hypothetical protein
MKEVSCSAGSTTSIRKETTVIRHGGTGLLQVTTQKCATLLKLH